MASSVVFVTSSVVYPNSGSTLLRGEQLRQLVAPHLARHGLATLVARRGEFRDAVLIVGKNTLLETSPEEIERWRRQGNVVCADPLDGRVADDVLDAADLWIASSRRQRAAFAARAPGRRVAYVGHHVDLRIGAIRPPTDRLRLAYFGELSNARHVDALARTVTFVRTDTSRADDTSWMAELPASNAHYAVRAHRPHDGFKPFTKGFLSAHCGCPILVDEADEEARQFLPDDYPYVADGGSVGAVRAAIRRMEADFGGATWRRAVASMGELRAASAPDVVARQLYEAIAPSIV